MSEFVKRVRQKLSKLSKEQLMSLLKKSMEDNEDFNSIIESLSIGMLIVDKNFVLKQYNTIVKSLLSFKILFGLNKKLTILFSCYYVLNIKKNDYQIVLLQY